MGTAIKESILQDVEDGGLAGEYISPRLTKVGLNVKAKPNEVDFVVAYAPTYTVVSNPPVTKALFGPH